MSRRRRSLSLRVRLTWTLVGVSLLAVSTLGLINYFQSQDLLEETVQGQLESTAAGRSSAIENGLERVQAQVAALARDEGVVQALERLTAGFENVEQTRTLSAAEEAELRRFYEENLLGLFEEADITPPPLDELLPTTAAGRYLQYQYIVENPFPADERRRLDMADDGSVYSSVHGEEHPFLRGLAETAGGTLESDLLLIESASDQAVYTVDKQIDFATDFTDGPYSDTELAMTVDRRLSEAAVGEAIVVDYDPWLPAGGSPTLFVAASIRSDREVIGALVLEVPAEALTALMTAGGQFSDIGLGRTGESYVVGDDRLMRSDSRLYSEDPDAYLDEFRSEGYPESSAALIEFADSTAFIQPVDNDAVSTALDGDEFTGVTTSYLGDETLTAAMPVGVDGLDWVVVAEVKTSETDNALNEYLDRILVIIAVVIPLVALVAFFLSRALTRPIPPLVGAAATVAGGDLSVELPDLGRNEIGDIARRLNRVTERLRAKRRELAEEEQQITTLLESALPRRLVDQVRSGRKDFGDIVDTATVVAVSVLNRDLSDSGDEEEATEITTVARMLEAAAHENGLERVRSTSEEHLFVAGLGEPGYEADASVRFVLAAFDAVEALAEESENDIVLSAGLADGDVAAGVLGEEQVSFGVWGDPPGMAMTLDALAAPGEILLDRSLVEHLDERWPIGAGRDMAGWDGQTLTVVQLERPDR